MASELSEQGLGDFLEWPPGRYLAEGLYNSDNSGIRQDLRGIHAIRTAFRFRYEGIDAELARQYLDELRRGVPAPGADFLPAMEALGKQLLTPPFDKRLYLYDFLADSLAVVKDPRGYAIWLEHVGFVIDRLAMLEALASSDASRGG